MVWREQGATKASRLVLPAHGMLHACVCTCHAMLRPAACLPAERFNAPKHPSMHMHTHRLCLLLACLPAQWGNLQDPIIILLIFAATVSTALGAGLPEQRAKGEWIEGVAIWVAVLLVSTVGEWCSAYTVTSGHIRQQQLMSGWVNALAYFLLAYFLLAYFLLAYFLHCRVCSAHLSA